MSRPRRVPPTPDQAIGFTQRRWFQRLQALEDAIAYRRSRIAVPCPDCRAMGAGRKCADHARDLELIAEYLEAAQRPAPDPAPRVPGHFT